MRSFCFSLMASQAWGFVFLSGPRAAQLPVDINEPSMSFIVGEDTPVISKKEDFLGGRYSELDDSAFFHALINEAMAVWNNVDTAYIDLQLVTDRGNEAALDRNDQTFSIVVDGVNATASAFARPKIDGDSIVDCDIVIGDRAVEAKALAYTLMHELGHCLGLGHNHTNYDSVMGYSREDTQLKLGMDDKIGITYLYPAEGITSPKENFGCGIVGKNRGFFVGFFLFSPLLLLMLRRRNVKNLRQQDGTPASA